MIVTVTFNPAIDKTAEVDTLVVGGLNRLQNVMMDAGGKGVNVSKTIQALDGESICTGFLAGNSGAFIADYLTQKGIRHDFVQVAGSTRTNLKVLDKEMELTELNEAGPIVTKEDIEALKEKILRYCDADTYVVLSGNVSPGVEKNIYAKLITEIHKAGGHTILDADGDLFRYGLEARPAVIKPNKYELAMYFGVAENCENTTMIQLAKTLLNNDTKLVVVSMGKEGSIFINSKEIYLAEALKISAHSSVGAGDAMVAAITLALAKQWELPDLIRLAVATSAGAVMTKGTQPAEKAVVEDLMKQVKITKWEE